MRLHLLHGVERSLTSYNILARECLYALGVGIITALAAICFNYMIHLVQWLCNTMWPQAAWSIPLSVALGGLLVGLLLWWRAKDLNEGGIPGVITSVFAKGGIIPGRVALIRMVTAALTIGSGGSAGREGPIVQIGASLGSKFARVFKLSEHKTILLLACGIAAGISSAFNAPVAGIFFALEIILARFTYHAFGLVVVSSVTSCLLTRSIVGDLYEFTAPIYVMSHYAEMFLFAGLGLTAAFVGVFFTHFLAFTEDLFHRLNCPTWLKPALGGLLCGCIAIPYPQIMGNGYDIIGAAVNGQLAWDLMFVLILAKIVGTSLTLGSGGAGGDLAPSLFIGCMLGGVYGALVNAVFPAGAVSSGGAYALIGMATVFAAAARAPLTAVFMIFEITGDYYLLMPLLLAAVIAALAAQALDKDSIYTLKLSRSVIESQHGHNPLARIKVSEIIKSNFISISPEASVAKLIEKFKETGFSLLAVANDEGRFYGLIDRRDIAYWRMRQNSSQDLQETLVKEIMRTDLGYVTPEDSLDTAVRTMGRCRVGCLPVLKSRTDAKLLAMLTRDEIFEAFIQNSGEAKDF